MKKSILILVIIHYSLFTIHSFSQAQLPNFTKVDTGALTVTPGGHISSSCFDMDNDGDLDLLISNSGVYANRPFSIYKNERNGCFVPMPGLIGNTFKIHLNSFGDIDNDGDADLFAGGVGSNDLGIYANDEYGNYQLDTVIWTGSSALYPSLIDLNNDGFLDVVRIDRMGRVCFNDGNGGFGGNIFLGLLHEPQNILLHGMSWGDPDNDGDFDAYGGYSSSLDGIGNLSKNACFMNNGDGTFVKFDETSVIVDDSTSENACVNWVDYDNDGDMDLYVLNFTLETDGPLSALYENLGNMQFTKHVFEDEMYRNSFTNSSVWGDLDNDADIDLYVSVENNKFPFWGDYTSATPYNLVFLNDGNGGFTNILDHPLALEDSHTAVLFDHDNDGDLDVLLTRYSWSNVGHTNLFVNEGNDNSWMVLTCEGTISNRSAIGTRVYAKSFVNGKHITQTREITPVNGHLSCANLRLHFGLANTGVIDTLLIRWPSGHVDEYLNVMANQFYRAVENEALLVDFKATNYIKYSPWITGMDLAPGEPFTIDLMDHYHLITGDTVPEISGDTLSFEVYSDDPTMVQTELNGSLLTLEAETQGTTCIHIIANAGFTARKDLFNTGTVSVPSVVSRQSIVRVYPNPTRGSSQFAVRSFQSQHVTIKIYDLFGQEVATVVDEVMPPGEHVVRFDVSELPAGVYMIRLQAGDQLIVRKLLVQ